MNHKTFQSDSLLLATAVIWGFAFVAQRVGMEYIGPFTFNGIRFAMGSLVLIPFVLLEKRRIDADVSGVYALHGRSALFGGILSGCFLFGGASFQQVGLVYTTAGKAGFITGLYVVIVPILGIVVGQRASVGTWIGGGLAAIGLYLLSIKGNFSISAGDLLVLMGAFVWAAHVIVIGWFSPRTSALRLALIQFALCSLMSLITAAWRETIELEGILDAGIALAYGGFLSVGMAYTLQVVAQRHAPPAHAAIILSLEAVFAAIGGWLLLDEVMSPRGMTGCGLMLTGMLLSQLWGRWPYSS